MIKFILFAAVVILSPVTAYSQVERAMILTQDGHCFETPQKAVLQGKIRGEDAKMYILVRADTGAKWWVQSPPTHSSGGHWSATVYLGRPNQDYVEYSGLLVVNPVRDLKEGTTLTAPPEAAFVSKITKFKKRPSGGC